MPFAGGKSLLRVTSDRLSAVVPPERQWVVTHRDYVDQVRSELGGVPRDQIIAEPIGRNTGPAIGVGAALMAQRDPEAVMVVQAADHWIHDVVRFRVLVRAAFAEVERRRAAVLIGFKPNRPATGYGYIGLGDRLPSRRRGIELSAIAHFKEKPGQAMAKRYVADGKHLWNGCMFFWHAETILGGIAAHLPEVARGLDRVQAAVRDGRSRERAIAAFYRSAPSISIEHGVVEKLRGAIAMVGDCGWEDVGTWGSLRTLLAADAQGNVVQGAHFGVDTAGSLILSDSGLVVTVGVRDLIIVKDGDAVLVLPRALESEVRRAIEALETDGRFDRFL